MFEETLDINCDRLNSFRSMIGEIPSNLLLDYVRSNSRLAETIRRGGYRIESKGRPHVEEVLVSEASPYECDSRLVKDLFFLWYKHQPFHDHLDRYFQSEEYKESSRQDDVPAGEYVVDDLLLNGLLKENPAQDFVSLLLFSPINFTKSQAIIIVNAHNANKETQSLGIEKKKVVEGKVLQGSNVNLERSKNEIRALKKENRRLEREASKFKEMVEGYQRASRETKVKMEEELRSRTAEYSTLSEAMELIQEESTKLRSQLKVLQDERDRKDRKIRKLNNQKDALEKDVLELKHVPILDQIIPLGVLNPNLIAALNARDDVKELLNSLLRAPRSDEEVDQMEAPVQLSHVWFRYQQIEEETINELMSVTIPSILSGEATEGWDLKSDQLKDLSITLRARTVLINLVYEILFNHHKNAIRDAGRSC